MKNHLTANDAELALAKSIMGNLTETERLIRNTHLALITVHGEQNVSIQDVVTALNK